MHALADIDAETATCNGAGSDGAMRAVKRDIVAHAVARLEGCTDKAEVAQIAGFEIAAMIVFDRQAGRRTMTLVKGWVSASIASSQSTTRVVTGLGSNRPDRMSSSGSLMMLWVCTHPV
jgi:hypothetical protein